MIQMGEALVLAESVCMVWLILWWAPAKVAKGWWHGASSGDAHPHSSDIDHAKRAYAEGDIDELELEQRLERLLDEREMVSND